MKWALLPNWQAVLHQVKLVGANQHKNWQYIDIRGFTDKMNIVGSFCRCFMPFIVN
jgi:hypothetical protein